MSKQRRTTKSAERTETNGVVAELETLRLPELQARYRDVLGETTKSPNRKFLIKKIAEALAAQVQPDAEATPEVVTEVPSEGGAVAEVASAPSEAEPSIDKESMTTTPPDSVPAQTTTAEPAKEKKPRGRFAAMSIEELQALYTEKVGRPSGSSHRGYLIWKIREAEKGRITVGPAQARRWAPGEGRDMKVLPLSLESGAVEKMDAAWRAKGIKSRAEFLRKAIGTYLTQLGATDEAALFTVE